MNKENHKGNQFTRDEWETCLKVLNRLKDNPLENPDNHIFSGLITKIYKKAKKDLKIDKNLLSKQQDLANINQSVIAKNALKNKTVFYQSKPEKEPTYTQLNTPRNCYVCNEPFDELHSFYHRMCPTCSKKNYENRFKKVELGERNIILTGGRVKVGFATALKLLRSNANLTITTRFPALALENFKKEEDFHSWKNRLEIYGLDLRNLREVIKFIEYYKSKNNTLDILVNNAAQTIKYPDEYYLPLAVKEQELLSSGEPNIVSKNNTPILSQQNLISQWNGSLDEITLNRFGNPIDEREKTSWNSNLEEIPLQELLEVNLINQISPYILIQGFYEFFKKSHFDYQFIINVTSSEGQFSYSNKSSYHPHTNMTKAALNMMTRTSAKAMKNDGILMNCVDVGWVSTGAIEPLRKRQFEVGYIPPLDSMDAAARIIHPIWECLEKNTIYNGDLIKNYQITDW